MDKEELAKSLFRGKEQYNCTQAVMAAFSKECDLSEADIRSYSNSGGGRAEGGICGAAHAVNVLLKDNIPVDNIENVMTEAAGAVSCREIRKNRKLPCRECVGLAARFVENSITRF